jgi:hypothetical protein
VYPGYTPGAQNVVRSANTRPEARALPRPDAAEGRRVIIDRELAAIYGVSTGRLNEAVKRSAERFPEDFMFQLTAAELENLRSQFAISSWGGRRS